MMLDYDPDETVLSQNEMLALLYEVCPALRLVDHIWWASSSSNILNTDTGEQVCGLHGQRVYFLVDNASDIPRAAKVLEDRLWLAELGHFKISASGALLGRTPFDMAVYQPSRLDFAAGAHCASPLQQQRGEPQVYRGGKRSLNTVDVFNEITAIEQQRLTEIEIAKRAIGQSKASAVKAAFITTMKERLSNRHTECDEDVLESTVLDAINHGELNPAWPVTVWMGNSFLQTTVGEVLSDRYRFHERLCLDPLEPEYDNHRLVGKLYLDQDKPQLFSYAGGGRSYTLRQYQYEITLEGNLHNAVNDSLGILKEGSDVFTYGGVLVTAIDRNLVYLKRPLMKHVLGRQIQYFKLFNKPCNPTNELVDGVTDIGAARNINPIKGFVDHPVLDGRLRLLAEPGYNPSMRLLGEFDPADFVFTDRVLAPEEIRANWETIWAPFTGFEFADDDSRTVALAAIFSAVLRQVLPTCPAFGFDAPMQGSGKTLLAETIAIVGNGQKPSAIAPGRSDYDEEFRKRLMALFLNGTKVCNFDNIVGAFDSPSLAAALTSETYEDRILGQSKTGRILNKTLFLFTGNNMQFVGDMSRRVLKSRLRPASDKLSQRVFNFDPTEKAAAMRADIISSILSLINHWKHSRTPKRSGMMTSFAEWDLLVRQPIAFLGEILPELGLVDVLDASLRQQDDSGDKVALIALLRALAAIFRDGRKFKATAALRQLTQQNEHLADAIHAFIPREKLQSSQHLGNLLRQFVERNVDGLVLHGKLSSGSFTYWVEVTDDAHLAEISQLIGRFDSNESGSDQKVVSLNTSKTKAP